MTDQPEAEQMPMITDEAAFCRTLGIDPDHVKQGTINVEFMTGAPVLTFTAMYAVPPKALGLAFLASAPHEEAQPEHKPAKKAAAKRPARKQT